MSTYQPTGRGLCAQCGHDVGRHDAGHRFKKSKLPEYRHLRVCRKCEYDVNDPIHDVGRVLRCPGGENDD